MSEDSLKFVAICKTTMKRGKRDITCVDGRCGYRNIMRDLANDNGIIIQTKTCYYIITSSFYFEGNKIFKNK